MLSKLFIAVAVTAGISAAPLPRRSSNKSLNNWGGLASLQGFDNFYGVDNYSGYLHDVNVVHDKQLVCHQKDIEIVQQRLLVIQEWAKKLITETVCEVETQTFVFEQFHGSLGHFSKDLRHSDGGHQVGYDSKIAEHFPKLWEDKYENWGFTGHDYGKNYVTPTGYNWKDESSPSSVHDAWLTSQSLGYHYKEPIKIDYSPPSYYDEPNYSPEYHAPEYNTEYQPPTYTHEYHAPAYTPTYSAPPAEYTRPAPSYAPAPWPSESPSAASSSTTAEQSAEPSASASPQSDPALAPEATANAAESASVTSEASASA